MFYTSTYFQTDICNISYYTDLEVDKLLRNYAKTQ